MMGRQRNLKITFELSWTVAEEAVDGSGCLEANRAYWVDKTIRDSRHTLVVPVQEQNAKIQEMDREGYRVVKILTDNF